ncbi:malto-oligosyltrehalose trehalohydrolase [Spirosoma sp. SC4-14]|uniref:malto-oligosyltrehalose trehalohydrolase n=1 Tax=Spirosoma sp. SC4-14 TaxID=3128900 RepID=UPI0030D081E8
MKTTGATYMGTGHCIFTVWAPEKKNITLHIVHPNERKLAMKAVELGYFRIEVDNVYPGTRYYYTLENGQDYPDPASDLQPEGVHGPSEVVDHTAYMWHDQHWRGLPFRDLIFYQLHVGTFTSEGTFEAIIPRLSELAQLGINALQLLPICQFPGQRNWGYDGVYLYSVQESYGGPAGLKKLVDACHTHGIAVFLDVVYNHMGPEGNYYSQFGPYFTEKYHTPWGNALNFDRDWADGVREFIANNTLFWFEQYHIDGLRFDAIHEVIDMGAVSIWELIYSKVTYLEEQLGRSLYLVAESDLNSPRVVKPPELGGYGFRAQWLDDFHHALHVLVNKAGKDKYADFNRIEQLARAYTDGFVSSGDYVAFRKRRFGASSAGISGDRFVVFNLNHDQVGNQSGRERLSLLVGFERQKVAAAAMLLAPYIPMLFMGEEYADESPFFYFVSHSDKELVEAVREGRKKEFGDFIDHANIPDPFEDTTFTKSKIKWNQRTQGKHHIMLRWHQALILLRQTTAALRTFNKNDVRFTIIDDDGFVLHRQTPDGLEHVFCLFNFSDHDLTYTFPKWTQSWDKLLDSKDPAWLESDTNAKQPLPDQLAPGASVTIYPDSVAVYSGRLIIG